MIFKQKILRLISALFAILACNCLLLAQAEYPRVLKTYIRINDNSKLIKDAKIKSGIEILSSNERLDTIRISNYDNEGYIVNEKSKIDTSRDKKGEYITRSYSFIYNNFKLLTEKVDSSGANLKKYYLKYDELYNITDEELFIQNKLVQKYSYEYDDLSRIVESNMKDIINDCKIIETYDYNSYNNLVKMVTVNKCISGEGKPLETKFVYTYDNSYRILGKTTNASSGDKKTETFTYNADGKPESSYEMNGIDSYTNRKYTYDKNTVRILKTEVKGELSVSSDVLIKYDKYGNRIEEEYFDLNGKLLFTYKFIYTYY